MSENVKIYIEHSLFNQCIAERETSNIDSFLAELSKYTLVISSENFNEVLKTKDKETRDLLLKCMAKFDPTVLHSKPSSLNILFDSVDSYRYSEYIKGINLEVDEEKIVDDFLGGEAAFKKIQNFLVASLNGNRDQNIDSDLNGFNNWIKTISPERFEEIKRYQNSKQFKENINDIKEVGDIKKIAKKKLNLAALSLNNLEPKLAIEKILKAFEAEFPSHLITNKTSDFLAEYVLYVLKSIYPKRTEPTKREIIFHLYNIVNLLSIYHPDKNITKFENIIGMNSDATHVGFSAYCDYFMTADKRQAYKAQGVLSYLGYKTKVCLINKSTFS